MLEKHIDYLYDVFKANVAEGRKLSHEEVEKLA
jgi:ClpP class serine protease